nr:hypothetical protein [Xanthomonas hyacinthi]
MIDCGHTIRAMSGLAIPRRSCASTWAPMPAARIIASTTHHREQKVVRADGPIAAPGTSPVSYAVECLRQLHPQREERIAQMRRMFAAEFV